MNFTCVCYFFAMCLPENVYLGGSPDASVGQRWSGAWTADPTDPAMDCVWGVGLLCRLWPHGSLSLGWRLGARSLEQISDVRFLSGPQFSHL